MGGICSDIEKVSIDDREICKNTANKLGMMFDEKDHDEPNIPKGCFYVEDIVGWNIHEAGKWVYSEYDLFEDFGELCLDSGKQIPRSSIF